MAEDVYYLLNGLKLYCKASLRLVHGVANFLLKLIKLIDMLTLSLHIGILRMGFKKQKTKKKTKQIFMRSEKQLR